MTLLPIPLFAEARPKPLAKILFLTLVTRARSVAGRLYTTVTLVNRGPAQVSSAVKASQLVYSVATNSANKITTAKATTGSVTEKRFKIRTIAAKFDSPRHVRSNEYIVSARKMTPQIQRIQRSGAKIVSITEVK